MYSFLPLSCRCSQKYHHDFNDKLSSTLIRGVLDMHVATKKIKKYLHVCFVEMIGRKKFLLVERLYCTIHTRMQCYLYRSGSVGNKGYSWILVRERGGAWAYLYQGCVAGLRSVGSSSRKFHCDAISFTMHKEDLLTKNSELGRGKPHPLWF